MIIEKAAVVVFEIDVLYSELFQYFVCFHLFIFFFVWRKIYSSQRFWMLCVRVFFSSLVYFEILKFCLCSETLYKIYWVFDIFAYKKDHVFRIAHFLFY